MTNTKLWFSKQEKGYYCKEQTECSKCNKLINDVFINVEFWSKREHWEYNYCENCFNKIKNNSLVSQYKVVRLAPTPPDAYPILKRKPEFVNTNISCFDLGEIERTYGHSQTNDKTKYAFTEPSIEGAKIWDDSFLEYKDNPINNIKEVDNLLLNLKNADIQQIGKDNKKSLPLKEK